MSFSDRTNEHLKGGFGIKLHNIVAVVMITLGAILLGFGCSVTFFDKSGYQETTATIQQIDVLTEEADYRGRPQNDYKVYVTYKVGDVVYEHQSLGYYQSDFYVGKQVKIYYNTANPANIKADASLFGIILLIVGGALIVIAFIARRFLKAAEEKAQNSKKIVNDT